MIDIIFFALVALYIGLKLYKTLGDTKHDSEMSEENKKAYEEFKQSIMKDIEIQAEKTERKQGTMTVAESALPLEMQALVKQIKKSQPDFSVDNFLKGTRYAFETILEAYANGDATTLKNLVAPDIAKVFMDNYNHLDSNGQRRNITIVSIQNADISSIEIENEVISIEVHIKSEQITNITDKVSGDLVDGSLTKVRQCQDTWTFEKSLTSKSKVWILSQS